MEKQVEMSLNGMSLRTRGNQRQSERAQWWFGRMRDVVDQARDHAGGHDHSQPSLQEAEGRH